MRKPEIRNVLHWRHSDRARRCPVLKVHAVVDNDLPATTGHGLAKTRLVFNAEDFLDLAHHTRELRAPRTSGLVTRDHDSTHNRTWTAGASPAEAHTLDAW
jgi:hypothetical protein